MLPFPTVAAAQPEHRFSAVTRRPTQPATAIGWHEHVRALGERPEPRVDPAAASSASHRR